MKYIERNSLYCSLVKNDLLLKNPQVRRLPNLSSPTVARLPRQVGPHLLADGFEFENVKFGFESFGTEQGLIWESREFINGYLSNLYELNDFFLEYRKAQNCLNLLDGHKQVRLNETLVFRSFFESKMQDLKNLKFAMGVGERFELQRALEGLDAQLLSETNAQMAKSSQEIVLRQLAADHHNQQSVFLSSVIQSVDNEISAALHSLGDDEVVNQRVIYFDDFGQPKISKTCGGFLSMPLSDPTNAKGYILSSGGFGSGGGDGFGSGGGDGFGSDGSDGFGSDGSEKGGLILWLLAFFYLGCLVVIIIVFQKIYGFVSRQCLSVCRRLRQSLQRWHRKKRRRKILKWLLRVYAWLLMSVPLLMAIPAGEAFFLDTMEALGIPAAFRFLRWFCRLFRYLMFLVIFIKSTGLGLNFLHYFYATMRPIIGEISQYIAAFGQASPQVFLSSLLHWMFLVQLGLFLDFCFVRKKYGFVAILLGLSLVCAFSMQWFFHRMASLFLSRVPELKLLTGCQLGRAVCFTAISFFLSRFKAGHFTVIFSAVFLYYFRIYQMVFLGSVPLFPNSRK